MSIKYKKMKVTWMPIFKKSTRKGKKYSVVSPKGKTIHFGASNMEQYKDSTGLGLYSHKDHGDKDRQKRYLARATRIRDGKGKLTYKNPESSNYYSLNWLWK